MSPQTGEKISIPRGNQRVLRVGPIPTGEYNPDGTPIMYDATNHTAVLHLKDDPWTNDLVGVKINGVVFGLLPGGFFVDFIITAAHTAVAGDRWMRVDLIPPGGQPRELVSEYIEITAA